MITFYTNSVAEALENMETVEWKTDAQNYIESLNGCFDGKELNKETVLLLFELDAYDIYITWEDVIHQTSRLAKTFRESKAEAKVTEAERIAKLEADLRKRDASKMLSEAGYPQELVDLLDLSNEEAMKASFEKVTNVYQTSLENGIKSHLKGRTPQSANDTKAGSVESQKENARKLLGIKKK